MNAALRFASGRFDSVRDLRQAVLDALPEALFLIDPATGAMQSLNSAAARWAPVSHSHGNCWLAAELLPELKLEKLPQLTGGFHLTRAIEPSTGSRRDVILHLYSLADDGQFTSDSHASLGELAGDSGLLILGLRLFDSAVSREELTSRDAFHDAFHDPLTRLPNRRLFHRRLERMIERSSRSSHTFAVLFVDLDRFKSVNDQFGHVQGDKLLISAAQRLLEAVRPQDMVARRDGDEFTVLLDDLEQPADAVGVAHRIVEHLQSPLTINTDDSPAMPVTIGASIGVVIANQAMLTAEELIARADAAMYQAKAAGGGVCIAPSASHNSDDALAQLKAARPR
jgi:diguanylate cyclase (GGDEF)-like protein